MKIKRRGNKMNNQDKATARNWYESNTGNHQGLIIEEETGKNIAVTYEKEHAALIVRAVNSHDELTASLEEILQCLMERVNFENLSEDEQEAVRDAENALNLAKGETL
jgi:K+/H+ antiporter YhaU regulatory subunit KhtT